MLQKIDEMPEKITHIWIEINGKIEVEESPDHSKYHSSVWGSEAWDIDTRGYFFENDYVVSCHSPISVSTLNKIERKFDKLGLVALKFHGTIKELCHA